MTLALPDNAVSSFSRHNMFCRTSGAPRTASDTSEIALALCGGCRHFCDRPRRLRLLDLPGGIAVRLGSQ